MDPVLVGTVSLALGQAARVYVTWLRARIQREHERARGESLAIAVAALPAGGHLCEIRPDGTTLVLTVFPALIQR